MFENIRRGSSFWICFVDIVIYTVLCKVYSMICSFKSNIQISFSYFWLLVLIVCVQIRLCYGFSNAIYLWFFNTIAGPKFFELVVFVLSVRLKWILGRCLCFCNFILVKYWLRVLVFIDKVFTPEWPQNTALRNSCLNLMWRWSFSIDTDFEFPVGDIRW